MSFTRVVAFMAVAALVFSPSEGRVSGAAMDAPVDASGRRLLQNTMSALDVIKNDPQLSKLASLAGQLSPTLQSDLTTKAGDVFTIFAPNDNAFQQLVSKDPSMSDALKNNTLVSNLLSYHVVPGVAAKAADLKDGQQLTTALPNVPPLTVSIQNQGMNQQNNQMGGGQMSGGQGMSNSNSQGMQNKEGQNNQQGQGSQGQQGQNQQNQNQNQGQATVIIKAVGDQAKVIKADQTFGRGVLHVVDAVLLPVKPSS